MNLMSSTNYQVMVFLFPKVDTSCRVLIWKLDVVSKSLAKQCLHVSVSDCEWQMPRFPRSLLGPPQNFRRLRWEKINFLWRYKCRSNAINVLLIAGRSSQSEKNWLRLHRYYSWNLRTIYLAGTCKSKSQPQDHQHHKCFHLWSYTLIINCVKTSNDWANCGRRSLEYVP